MKTPNVCLTPNLGVVLLKVRGFQLVKLLRLPTGFARSALLAT